MTHSCPGACGQLLGEEIFACPACDRRLPLPLRSAVYTSFWAADWPAHSVALTRAMHWLASHPGRGWADSGGDAS